MKLSDRFTLVATVVIVCAALYFWYKGDSLLTLVALFSIPAPLLASIIENYPPRKRPGKE